MVCLNINCYSGGVKNIWKNAGSKSTQGVPKNNHSVTSYSDGQLEFITFDSILGIVNERYHKIKIRYYGGNAKKVAQGKGPFQLNFKQSELDLITHF